jgi:leader peptidase (prepilin peptidase)/N-methyltransferase
MIGGYFHVATKGWSVMDLYVNLFWAASSFLLGAIVGSFLNVVIARVPAGQSIIYPPSHCPACRHQIRWHDNVPILSYFMLLGRCRDCGGRISMRYPLIEFLFACMSLGLYLKYDLSPAFGVFFIFTAAMVAVFWIDLDHMIIPDVISLNGTVVGLATVTAGLVPGLTWKDSFIGLALGALILYIPAVVYQRIRGVEGLGGGDIKLLAMIGAFLGPYGVIFVLFFASFIGSLAALGGIALRRTASSSPIPFGPFLTAAAILYVFAGQEMVDQFLEFSRVF